MSIFYQWKIISHSAQFTKMFAQTVMNGNNNYSCLSCNVLSDFNKQIYVFIYVVISCKYLIVEFKTELKTSSISAETFFGMFDLLLQSSPFIDSSSCGPFPPTKLDQTVDNISMDWRNVLELLCGWKTEILILLTHFQSSLLTWWRWTVICTKIQDHI